MQSNDDQEVKVKVKFIPKVKRRSLHSVKGTIAGTNERVEQSQSIHNVKKRRNNTLRLKFKSERKLKFEKLDLKHDETEQDLHTEDKVESSRPEKIQENRKSQTKHTPKPNYIQEYGPSIGGYRFVALSNEDLIDFDDAKPYKRPSVYSGYFEKPGYTSEPEYESDSVSHRESRVYDYDWYCNLWDIIDNGERLEKIPLPLGPNNTAELNEVLVWEFLRYEKNVRLERIRWHPDKMMVKLKKIDMFSKDTEKMVTSVFQIINKVYEDYCLSKQK